MKKIKIRKGDDQIITFRSNGKKITSVKVFPGNDLLTMHVNPELKKKRSKEPSVKLYGNKIQINKMKTNVEKMITVNNDKEVMEIESSRKINQLLGRGFMVFATAIINPYGPTLTMYYLDRKRKPRLLELMIHPLEFRLFEVAEVKTDKQGVIQSIQFYSHFVQYMPTLFLKNEAVAESLLKEIMMTFMDIAEEVGTAYSMFKRFEGKTEPRIMAEIQSVMDDIDAAKEAAKPGETLVDPKAEDDQFDKSDFLRLLLKEKNYSEELNMLYDYYINSQHIGTPENMWKFHSIYEGLIYDCGLDDKKFPRNSIY